MPIDYTIRGLQDFNKAMREAPELLAENSARGLSQAMFATRGEWIADQRSKGRKNIGHRFRYEVRKSKAAEDIEASFYTESFVAETLEHGATIRARGHEYVAIPIGGALTASGRRKKRYSDIREVFRRLEGGGYRWIPTSRGAVVLESRRASSRAKPIPGERNDEATGRRLIPIFVMLRSVSIKPQLGAVRFIGNVGLEKATERVNAAIEATLRGQRLAKESRAQR